MVKLTKRKAQAIMLDTRLEQNLWEYVVNYLWKVHNLYPLSRNATNSGQGLRPLTELSKNHIDENECDRRIEFCYKLGTLAWVHVPQPPSPLPTNAPKHTLQMLKGICTIVRVSGWYEQELTPVESDVLGVTWTVGLKILHWLYNNRDKGICYRSDGNTEPIVYYDSSFIHIPDAKGR
eukprot:COSAG01_NODE_3806_length_5679_cov_56.227061_4_plen_178_part_00